MKLFIIISHYLRLSQAIKEYLTKMLIQTDNVKIEAIGGLENGEVLGTQPLELLEVINNYPNINEIFIFPDLGSASLTAESITSMLNNKQIYISRGGIVENTFAAYVLANSGAGFQEVVDACKEPIIK
ncbi:dihydroxyacetone kinase DhaM subunit [Mycoplasmopsis mustelae]|uniref:Dihydroxyacetone kinase DhaM subunit n=1 Tax=Mycoplasmopsis mustelae TaxID=171289 RepID=A0A4R7UD54_9BACT|nr:dihydroxyacetone kinase [Mycoplasmopsis mustelae]TDV24387.1 dihydroxyacetone kinase DhaM subunit [Mycoplasmopsis mustelae]